MKIAVLSDIHGNKYALEKVLGEARKEGVNKLFILGDLVGYYYYPEEVIRLLKEWDFTFIRGNHEKLLQETINHELEEEFIRKKYGSGLRMARDKMLKTDIEFIINAPDKLEIEIDRIKFLLCHGSPWEAEKYLYPDTPKEILNKCQQYDVNFVLTGHSHYAFTYKAGNTVLINNGSVGQSRKKGGIADWFIIETNNGSFRQMSTLYDVDPLIKEVKEIDADVQYLYTILKR